MRRLFILLVIIAGLLVGCTGAIPTGAPGTALPAEQSDAVYPPPTQTPPTPEAYLGPEKAPAPAGPRGELPEGAVISYSRSGGFAGVEEEWFIYPDGRVAMTEGGTQQMTAEQVNELLAGLQEAGFFTSPGYSSPPGVCADCFTYTLAVEKDGQVYTAQVLDSDQQVPQAVRDALALVTQFLMIS